MTIDAITPGARVLCAVSGGVDSMYLLHRMTELAAQRGFTVGCAHFNHGLRGAESDRDEAFVRTQCAHLGVPFYAGRGDVSVRARHGHGGRCAAIALCVFDRLRGCTRL
ncbi:MAG: ATP-binding protein [Oscillospiraceae bacterium]